MTNGTTKRDFPASNGRFRKGNAAARGRRQPRNKTTAALERILGKNVDALLEKSFR